MLRPGMTRFEKWLLTKFGPYKSISEENHEYFGTIHFVKKNGDFGAIEWDRWGEGRPMWVDFKK